MYFCFSLSIFFFSDTLPKIWRIFSLSFSTERETDKNYFSKQTLVIFFMGRILFWSTLPVATNFDCLFKQQTALSVCLPAWFWENTRKFSKSLASSSHLTNFSNVLLTFRMGYYAGKQAESAVCCCKINSNFLWFYRCNIR